MGQAGFSPERDLECRNCGALLHLFDLERSARCLYCLSTSILERPIDPNRPDPSFVIPFVIDRDTATALLGRWQRSLSRLTPAAVRKAAVAELRGVYLPVYLYSAIASSDYTVQIGEEYTVGSGDNKRTVTEWRPLAGRFVTYVRDVVVTASRGLPNAELQHVEPFDLRTLHRYAHKFLSGWSAEEPSMQHQQSLEHGRHEAHADVGRTLRGFLPGDSQSNLQHNAHLTNESLDLTLVPVWMWNVRYHRSGQSLRVLVNGQTGKLHAVVPKQWWRVVVVILLALLLFGSVLVGLILFIVFLSMVFG